MSEQVLIHASGAIAVYAVKVYEDNEQARVIASSLLITTDKRIFRPGMPYGEARSMCEASHNPKPDLRHFAESWEYTFKEIGIGDELAGRLRRRGYFSPLDLAELGPVPGLDPRDARLVDMRLSRWQNNLSRQ